MGDIMAEIRFKAKKNEVRLNVIIECEDGEKSKELVFNCSPNDYGYITKIVKVFQEMEKLMIGKMTIDKTGKMLEAERSVFEAAAPGRWDEFIEFVDNDIEYMAQLIALMVQTIREKGTATKIADITPVVPDGETV